MSCEVITFGEAMIRLHPPASLRIEQTHAFEVQVGGAELNTAVGLCRLGRSAAWVSRVTDNPLGRLLVQRARGAGVCVEHVQWTDQDRVGIYFVEFGAAPRPSSVLYDRKGSAMAAVQPGTIPWGTIFSGARWFHVTGITPALSPSAAETTREAVEAARRGGLRISLDLNYRAKLWSPGEARRCLHPLVCLSDVLITTEEDADKVLGLTGSSHEETARTLAGAYPNLYAVAITIRENPLVWRNRWTALVLAQGTVFTTRTYEVEIVDRLGAGDAFAAGLIHGLLDGDVQRGLDLGVALSALKHSVPGDFAWIDREEVEGLLRGMGLRISR